MKLLLGILPMILLTGVVLFTGCKASRAGYESAPYQVVQSDGAFEIRDYPPLAVVETSMNGANGEGSFRRLFRFISGQNAAKEKIAMTTPVLISHDGSGRRMAFVLPARVAESGAPDPADATLGLREMPPGRFAVLRFGGGRSAARENAMLERLQEAMRSRNLKPDGGATFAYFDPPWTPGILRRNEVMLRIMEEG